MKISNLDYLFLAICLVLVCFGLFEIVVARKLPMGQASTTYSKMSRESVRAKPPCSPLYGHQATG
jgi:hypothetical protein